MHSVPTPSKDTRSTAHKNTHCYASASWCVASWNGTNNGGMSTVGFQSCHWHCVSLASRSTKTHTFACPRLKQHREQGLWIINTSKFPQDSGHGCPPSKRCWCVEEESQGRNPKEYKMHVQTTQVQNRVLPGSEMGLRSMRVSGLKLQTSCFHTDNWHAKGAATAK